MIPLLNAREREQVYEADILGCFRPFEPDSYKYYYAGPRIRPTRARYC